MLSQFNKMLGAPVNSRQTTATSREATIQQTIAD